MENREDILRRIDKNRNEINNILFQDWPIDLKNMRIKMLSSQNERLIEKLKKKTLTKGNKMTNLEHWGYFEKVLRYLVLDSYISVDDGYDHNLTIKVWDYSYTFRYRDWDNSFSLTYNDREGYTIDEVTDLNYLKLYEWLQETLNR